MGPINGPREGANTTIMYVCKVWSEHRMKGYEILFDIKEMVMYLIHNVTSPELHNFLNNISGTQHVIHCISTT